MKNNLPSLTALMIITLTCLSCELIYEQIGQGTRRADTLRGEKEDTETSELITSRTGVYVTALDYPEDYDWRRDSAYGLVKARILLFRNGEEILALETGAGTDRCASPDKHHFIDGHLYTEYPDGRGTVIQKDGKEIIRYEGAEIIKGMLIQDGSLYILGQRLDGKGLYLRRDGEPIFSREGAVAAGGMDEPSYGHTGALYEESGQLCFAYYKSLGSMKMWHFVSGGTDTPIEARDGMSEICDVKRMDGHLCVIGMDSYGKCPILSVDGACTSLPCAGTAVSDLKLYMNNGDIGFNGTFSYNRVIKGYTGFCGRDGNYTYRIMNCKCFNGNSWLATRNGLAKTFNTPQGSVSFGSGYRFLSSKCIAWAGEDDAYIALTPSEGDDEAILWHSGQTSGFNIHGCLTGVYIIN